MTPVPGGTGKYSNQKREKEIMFVVMLAQIGVCILLLFRMLKNKGGERFTAKAVWKFLLAGVLVYFVLTALSLLSKVDKKMFWHIEPPLLAGFLTSLLLAAIPEEGVKYIFFRLAARKNSELVTRHDAVIAAVITAIGFTVLEDIQYTVFGSGNLLRALLPMHLLFQGAMGYWYGRARAEGKPFFHVLSLAVPVLMHTVFDMFLISMMAVYGTDRLEGIDPEASAQLPYFSHLIPLFVGFVVVSIAGLAGLILLFVKIRKWNLNGQLQEPLQRAD